MTVAIIDYGSGNLLSAAKAFQRAAVERGYAGKVMVTASPEAVAAAERIVLPGVGAFGDCRQGLDALDGMTDALVEAVVGRGRPFLGICVGMQLMATRGHEHGVHAGLDWIGGDVTALTPADPALKIPHMGWNAVHAAGAARHPVLAGVPDGAHAYFVHSFQFAVTSPDHLAATTEYGGPIAAVVARDNMVGTQFHPEKSQAVGLRLIGNFLAWRP